VLRLKQQGLGKGEPLLIIHGWGMNSSVWKAVAKDLERHFQVTWLDLPGHGNNSDIQAENLLAIVDKILPVIKKPTHIIGWSLGGLIAQEILKQSPELIKKIVLVASTPRFSQSQDWKNAMSTEVLQAFSDNLQKDIKGTIKRFIALQFIDVKGSQTIQRELREKLLSDLPAESALMTGLDILQYQDLRHEPIKHDNLWILGERDRLVPVEVKQDLATLFSNANIKVISGAGHAPFMTHPKEFVAIVIDFLTAKIR